MTNIGSVPIRNLQVSGTKIIGEITCAPKVTLGVNPGQTSNKSICIKTYTVTQANLNAGKVDETTSATS